MDACIDVRDLQFNKADKLDSYVVCCDQDMNIYVFIGGGFGTGNYFLDKDSTRDIYHANGRDYSIFYMVYPEVSSEYLKLGTPADIKWANE